MRTRRREPEEEPEGYFASISDLMVGILLIFLLMLTVFALNFADDDKDAIIARLTRERDAAISKLAQEQAELATLISRVDQIEADLSSESRHLQELREQLLKRIQADLQAHNVQIEISEEQDVLRLPSEEIFQRGNATFTPRGREQIQLLLEELAKLLPCYAASSGPAPGCTNTTPIFETILFEGHTDTVRFDNWRLSTDRARAMLDLMSGPLASLADLRNSAGQRMLGLAGYGESRTLPGISGEDPRNRRIEVRFLLTPSHEAEIAQLRHSLSEVREKLEALRAP